MGGGGGRSGGKREGAGEGKKGGDLIDNLGG